MREIVDHSGVSVALCTHNGARYLAEQLRSILHQTHPPVQVVISDDASSDATVQIAKDVFARFRAEKAGPAPVLTVLQNISPLGVAANFQQAVTSCTQDLIALCDQDDVWSSNRLERMVREFDSRTDLTLLHSDARLVDDAGNSLGGTLSQAIGLSEWERRKIHAGQALDVLLRRNVVTGATTLFRRSLLDFAVPFPTAWVHDEWLGVVAAITGRVDFLPVPLTDYRQHATNQIGAAKPTLSQKFGRVREGRSQRNERLLLRALALRDRAERFASPREAKLFSRKVSHEQFRSGLPKARLLRILPVLWHGMTGSYRRFGRARYDMLRDLLQPDR